MGVRDLLVLFCLLSAAVQTKQESPSVMVMAQVMTTCSQPVTLHCNVSSSKGGLFVKHLSWIHNNVILCNVKDDQLTEPTSGVQCSYTDQRLSLNFLQTTMQKSNGSDEYICKLRSDQGVAWGGTSVKLKECSRDVEVAMTAEGPTCTFTGVHPDGDVHWFHGATRLRESDATPQIKKSVDEGGYLTIIGSLQAKDHTRPYTCSLWNDESKTYTMSKVVSPSGSGTLVPLWSIWRFFMVSVLLMTL